METNQTPTIDHEHGLRLGEGEARVLCDLSEVFDHYRRPSGLTEIEVLTLRKVEDIVLDMLTSRAHDKTVLEDSAPNQRTLVRRWYGRWKR